MSASSWILILLVFQTVFELTNAHNCAHDRMMEEIHPLMMEHHREKMGDIENKSEESLRRRLVEFQKIRIHVDTRKVFDDARNKCSTVGETVVNSMNVNYSYVCTESDILTDEKRNFLLNEVLESALDFFQYTLSVRPHSGNLMAYDAYSIDPTYALSRALCFDQDWVQTYVDDGIADTDFVIGVTTRPNSGSTIAWAIPCQNDSDMRPTFAQINFDPKRLDSSSSERRSQVATAIHEMSHALGFTNSLFSFYRAADGTAYAQVTKEFTERGKTVTKMVTPSVVAAAKDHFGCDSWVNAGLELEDQGSSGSKGSHWEKRILNNEFMTATSSNYPVISAMTMAAFQDSGWYNVDTGRTELLNWGLKEGCAFVDDYCSSWNSNYFCQEINLPGCTVDGIFKSTCNLRDMSPTTLPASFQYFDDASWGGSSFYDYCPIFYPDFDSSADCRSGEINSGVWFLGETHSAKARCIVGDFAMTSVISQKKRRATCQEIQCVTKDDGSKELEINLERKYTIKCPVAGGEVDLYSYTGGSYTGTMMCPPAKSMCANFGFCPDDCNQAGTCLSDGSCECWTGFAGDKCEEKLCPNSNDQECGGEWGTCDRSTGVCECISGRYGSSCENLTCPKDGSLECSGRGSCNASSGMCECEVGYDGIACEYFDCPGHVMVDTEEKKCSDHGSCETSTGTCVCSFEEYTNDVKGDLFFGSTCAQSTANQIPTDRYSAVEISSSLDSKTLVPGVIPANSYIYRYIDIDNVDFDVTVGIEAGVGDKLSMFFSYSADPPTVNNHLFSSEHNRLAIEDDYEKNFNYTLCGTYSKSSDVNTCPEPDYNTFKVGMLKMAIYNNGQFSSTFNAFAYRDACASLECANGAPCIDGACKCTSGWSGAQCDIPDCPGTPDCLNHGVCTIGSVGGKCECEGSWDGDDCSELKNDSVTMHYEMQVEEPVPGTPVDVVETKTGTLDIGEEALYIVHVPTAALVVTVEVTKKTEDSDPLLMGRKGSLPTLVLNDIVATASWNEQKTTHTIVLDSKTGLRADTYYFIVLNSAYAKDALEFEMKVTVQSECTGDIGACSGNGNCSIVSDGSTPTCICAPGYTGQLCEIPLVELTNGVSLSDTIEIGDWQDYYISVPKTAVELEIEMNQENSTPDLLLMFKKDSDSDTPPRLENAASVLIDFDGIKDTESPQKITYRQLRSGNYYISVHNRIFSAAPAEFTIKATLYEQKTVNSCSDEDLCNGRGECVTEGGSAVCRCQGSWAGVFCNTPNLGSIQNLQRSAQNIEFLCNMCNDTEHLTTDEFKMFKVPQPLHASTALQIDIETLDAGVYNTSNPDIYISDILPRSVFDFLFISAVNGANETMVIDTQSRSGRYWMAVYAGGEGEYLIDAHRKELETEDPLDESFIEEIKNWATDNIIVAVSLLTFTIIMFGMCCWSLCGDQATKDRMAIKKAIGNVANKTSARFSRAVSFRRSTSFRTQNAHPVAPPATNPMLGVDMDGTPIIDENDPYVQQRLFAAYNNGHVDVSNGNAPPSLNNDQNPMYASNRNLHRQGSQAPHWQQPQPTQVQMPAAVEFTHQGSMAFRAGPSSARGHQTNQDFAHEQMSQIPDVAPTAPMMMRMRPNSNERRAVGRPTSMRVTRI
eukprot:TRINITY_DN4357_c0_g2_i1.p1 TRINITY_DN4357_c0_g2~~TRINITY_DN4357_c0_g2_i1.p1  ORF type:complete len:1627 (+),score=510.57 TRINITY_DN4357_c0_g2_i1:84-4964(+)